jgi:hypothetical protein
MQVTDQVELESEAAAIVGRIVFVISRLEFNLGLYLRHAVGGPNVERSNPLVSRLTFKAKLDALREVVEDIFAGNDQCLAAFRQWYAELDRFRSRRNAFIHGRWAVHGRRIVNVAVSPAGSHSQRQTHYDMSELQRELHTIQAISKSFFDWCDKWPA